MQWWNDIPLFHFGFSLFQHPILPISHPLLSRIGIRSNIHARLESLAYPEQDTTDSEPAYTAVGLMVRASLDLSGSAIRVSNRTEVGKIEFQLIAGNRSV